jgi:hypothetical protein
MKQAHKNKISLSMIGKNLLSQAKQIVTPKGVFPSLTQAAQAYGLSKEAIRRRTIKHPESYYYEL